MQYALQDGRKVGATKGARGACPNCGEEVLARCGSIRVAHWAHIGRLDCDPWSENETEWHRNWKALFPLEQVEVTMAGHRADIVALGNLVVELQNSPISKEMIAEREKAYGRMIWIVNAALFSDRLFLMERYGSGNAFKLRWLQKRPSWLQAKKPVYLDLGDRCVRDLLGEVKFKGGDPSLYPPSRRFDRAEAPPEIENAVGLCDMLRVNTLYESGWGSVKALRREDLLGRMLRPSN